MNKKPPLIVIFCLAINAALCLLYLIDYTLGQPSYKLTQLVDLDGESSLATWYSSMQLFCISILGTIFVYRKLHENKKATSLIFLPIIFLLLSIDESVQIHEWLGKKTDILLDHGTRAGTVFSTTGIWMFVIGIPFLVIFLLWAYSIKKHFATQPHTLRRFIFGMILLLTGALGFESLSNWETDIALVFSVIAEELCEMTGATIILWAVYEMTMSNFSPVTDAVQPLYRRKGKPAIGMTSVVARDNPR